MKFPDIIIVEDDPLVGEIARNILAVRGYDVKLVQESREALEAIAAARPRLVITDIMMPGVTGLDICKAVKSDPALKDVRLMVMSAKSFVTEKKRAAMFGAVAFLAKPFSETALADAVRTVIGDPPGEKQSRI